MIADIAQGLISGLNMEFIKDTDWGREYAAPTDEYLTVSPDRITLYDRRDGYALMVVRDAGKAEKGYGIYAYLYAQEALTSENRIRIRDCDVACDGLLSGAMMRACEFSRLKINGDGYDKADTVETRAMVVLMMQQHNATS